MTNYHAVLIDAGTGNLHSVHNAIQKLGFNVLVTSNPADLSRPARIILPGVGAFGSFMQGLNQRELGPALQNAARRGDPLLGICVGMQALFEVSEEMGEHAGLGLLQGRVIRFPHFTDRKVPHTGWNQLWQPALNSEGRQPGPLFRGLPQGSYAYFNHSFYCAPALPSDAAATTDYGLDFASAVQRDNLYGVQFHPEKSQAVGQAILSNFMEL
jgi:imidazole glycerol-phosphate synthase subunit HisH